MTEGKKAGNATRPRKELRNAADPVFKVVSAPRPTTIITSRGLNAPPPREQRPLTTAVLATLGKVDAYVEVDYDKETHARLWQRFQGIQQRQKSTLHFQYSLVLHDQTQQPIRVQYWCEAPKKPDPPAPPPSSPSREPIVGRDVE